MNVIAILSKFTRKSQLRVLKDRQILLISQRLNSEDASAKSSIDPTDDQYEKNIRHKILNASLQFVPEFGWTKDALTKGAESLGYPGITHGVFPKGGADLVHFFYTDCNQKLAEQLKKESEVNANIIPAKFVQNAVETRLRMIVPYKARWAQAVAIMSLPPNVPTTLANLLTLVDDICYYAGDKSVDFKWYSRRIALGGLYKTTELYLIQDHSPDHQQTWMFLSRRIDELSQIHAILNQSENLGTVTKETFTSAFATSNDVYWSFFNALLTSMP